LEWCRSGAEGFERVSCGASGDIGEGHELRDRRELAVLGVVPLRRGLGSIAGRGPGRRPQRRTGRRRLVLNDDEVRLLDRTR
jgi:hypothetical protein